MKITKLLLHTGVAVTGVLLMVLGRIAFTIPARSSLEHFFIDKPNDQSFDILNAKFERIHLPKGGINLNVLTVGENDPSKEMIIFLHGFPETALLSWHNELRLLATPENLKKYFLIAPDQRGYNTSDKPFGFWSYQTDYLVQDVIELIDHFKKERVILIGHDWGAAVAWNTAMRHPNRLSKLVALNVPHPTTFVETLKSNTNQLKKSWYMFFFLTPVVPELTIAKDDYAFGVAALTGAKPHTFSKATVQRYIDAWSQPGALSGMLNWYRAAFLVPSTKVDPRIKVPTLILWGDNDTALESSMASNSTKYCDNAKVIYLKGSSHWVQHDEPEEIHKHIVEFLKK